MLREDIPSHVVGGKRMNSVRLLGGQSQKEGSATASLYMKLLCRLESAPKM